MQHPRSALAPEAAIPDPDPVEFEINPELDLDALRRQYRADGRVRIFGLLSRGAMDMYDHLQGSDDWIHLVNHDGGVLELDAADKAALPPGAWAEIEEQAHLRSRSAFQYRYEAMRVPVRIEERVAGGALTGFAELMESPAMLALLSEISGEPVRCFADGQATAYGPGDFLTVHDDAVEGKNRLAAYVFGLTPGWRIDWGGLLLFHGDKERTAEALAPRFNTLDLFAVPRPHSVSLVTPAAPHRRYSLTGWLQRT